MTQVSSMNNFILTAVIIVTIQVSLCQAGSGPIPTSDENIESEVTRLISLPCRRRGRRYNKPEPIDVPCVPRDLDDVCRSNNFLRAIALGNPDRPDSLRSRPCLVGRRWGRYGSCPSGSTCVRVQNRRGVCCYGDMSGLTDATSGADPKCPDRCDQPCPSGESCQKCGDGFACLPKVKPGSCPNRPAWTRGNCWCLNDNDCAGIKKCCHYDCVTPRYADPSDGLAVVCPTTTPEPTSSSTSSTTESSTSSTTSGDPPL